MRRFKVVDEDKLMCHSSVDEVKLPLRATKHSAGYDFFAPCDLTIKPQETAFFWSDVCVEMRTSEFLLLDIRSSLGCKHDLALANTVAIIDSDYIYSENGGNIGIKLRNLKPQFTLEQGKEGDISLVSNIEEGTIHIKKGERVCQGIFMKYEKSVNCNSESDRTGGFGSTDE